MPSINQIDPLHFGTFMRKPCQHVLVSPPDPVPKEGRRCGTLKAIYSEFDGKRKPQRRLRRKKAVNRGKFWDRESPDDKPVPRFPVEIIGKLPPDGIPRPPSFIYTAPIKRFKKPLPVIPFYDSDPFSASPTIFFPENVRIPSQFLPCRETFSDTLNSVTPPVQNRPSDRNSFFSTPSIYSQESAHYSAIPETIDELAYLPHARCSVQSDAIASSLGSLISRFPAPQGYDPLYFQNPCSPKSVYVSVRHSSPPPDVPPDHLSVFSECTEVPRRSSFYPSTNLQTDIIGQTARLNVTTNDTKPTVYGASLHEEFREYQSDDEEDEDEDDWDLSTESDVSDLDSDFSDDTESSCSSQGSHIRREKGKPYLMYQEAVLKARDDYFRKLKEAKDQFAEEKFKKALLKQVDRGVFEAASYAQARRCYPLGQRPQSAPNAPRPHCTTDSPYFSPSHLYQRHSAL